MHKILNWSQSGVGVPLDSLQLHSVDSGSMFILLFAIKRCFSYVVNCSSLILYLFGKFKAVSDETAKETLALLQFDASRLLPGPLFLPQASG